jgi:hypothetical protein
MVQIHPSTFQLSLRLRHTISAISRETNKPLHHGSKVSDGDPDRSDVLLIPKRFVSRDGFRSLRPRQHEAEHHFEDQASAVLEPSSPRDR